MSSPAELLAEGLAPLPLLTRFFEAYSKTVPTQRSIISDAARQQRAAWRRLDLLASALASAGFATDTAALIQSVRDDGPIPPFAAAEILGGRPGCVSALLPLITEPAEAWLAQQIRWGRLARVAEGLGASAGEPLLSALWAETGGAYRDVHYAIERCLLAWGPDTAPFLLARLASDGPRVRTAAGSLASRWGWTPPAALRRVARR